MSQAGILDVINSNPQIPTQFNGDSGDAIPIGNQLDMEGNTVANATYSKPVFITASGMTVTTNVQVGAAITGAPIDNNDAGLVSFDDTMFTVDTNGFVQLIGGGAGIDSINVDAFTAPGTDPVIPDGAGMITVTGAQVASGTVGTNVIRTDSLAANTYTIEIQRATMAASPTLAANGVSHFDSDIFTVDSSGFVSASGTGLGQTLTPDVGGALAPTGGNWDILGGHDINTAGAGSTLTVHLDNAITLGDLAVLGAGVNALDCDTGDINLDSGNIKLPNANAALDQGLLTWTDGTRLHNFGSDNIFHGIAAGNGTLTGANNVAIGQNVLSALTSGGSNVGIGTNCLRNISSANQNVGMGIATLTTLTTSTANTCIGHNSGNLISTGSGRNSALGYQTLNKITTGTDNTGLGYQAGFSYTGTETNNICIGAGTVGTLGESNVTRIGNAQNACYIDGIDGVNVGSTATVVTEASDRLGTAVITAGTGIDVTPGANTITIAVDGSTMQSLTPSWDFDGTAATPVLPQSGNINVLSYNPSPTNTATNFITGTLNSTGASTGNLQIENRAWETQFIVDASSTIGQRGTYATIAAAMTAASAGDTVFLRSAITENFTIKANVNLVGWPVSGSTSSPSITGKITMSTAGMCTISGIKLITNGDYFLETSGAVSASVILDRCNLQCTNFSGINQTATSGAIRILNCNGDLGTTGIALFASTAGTTQIVNCPNLANSGGSTTASTKSAGTLFLQTSSITNPITTSGTAAIQAQDCYFAVTNTTCLTHGGSGTVSFIRDSKVDSGTASAISVGASGVLYCEHNDISSSNTNVITGAGSLLYGSLTFSGSSSNINTTTTTVLSEGPSRTVGSANTGATNTLTVTNSSNTASSVANIVSTVGGTSAGDATYQAVVSGTTTWTWGVDNSDSDAFVIAQGTTLGTNNILRSSTAGEITNPLQPAFLASLPSNDANVTGNGTTYTLGVPTALTEVFDQNADFNTNGTFTAPVTGKYYLTFQIRISGVAAATTTLPKIVTSNRTYTYSTAISGEASLCINTSALCDMDAADTATFTTVVNGLGVDTATVVGNAAPFTYVTGYLAC